MSPKEVHLDFEEALSAGFVRVFPNATPMKDFFYFIQANVKKAGQLGMATHRSKIVVRLNTLWYKPTKAEFDTCLKEFLGEWDKKAPQYTAYFCFTWLDRFVPNEWASYARPSNSRSGVCETSILKNIF
jgi:hypothetical protein